MKPTEEQRACLDLFMQGDSMVIEALAGTGKTTTLALLASATRRRGRYLAFNRSIIGDVAGKLPDRCAASTAHSLAFRAVGVRYAHRLSAGRMKSSLVAEQLRISPAVIRFGEQTKTLAAGFLAGHVMRAAGNFCRSIDDEPSRRHFTYIDGIDLPTADGRRTYENNNRLAAELEPALRKAWDDLRNPDGQLRFSHDVYLRLWQMEHPRLDLDYVLFDEGQDADPVITAVVMDQADHAQICVVGDRNQQIYCQPTGTMVRVPIPIGGGGRSGGPRCGYREVPIETLAVGDRVVSWSPAQRRGGLRVRGSVISGVARREYVGPLVVATTEDGTSSRYTPDHHCVVAIGDAFAGQHVVYMMRRGNQYRIGRAPWRYASQGHLNGPMMRATAEGADAWWILSAHDTSAEAALAEALAAHASGVPDVCFTRTHSHLLDVDAFWAKVGDNAEAARACLAAHGRLIEHPLWVRGDGKKFARQSIVTVAANLHDGMRLCAADLAVQHSRSYGTPLSAWRRIRVEREFYVGSVISLSVNVDHTYVADGLVTHNSWRGAIDAMGNFETDHHRFLSQSFRFGPAIADAANVYLDLLGSALRVSGTASIPSEVVELERDEANAILCRSNARAIREVLEAQRDGVVVHLVGGGVEVASFARGANDLQSGRATSHPELACFTSWPSVQEYVVNDPLGEELALLVGLVDEFGVATILRALDHMPPENEAALVVSTAHKAKGREWAAVKIAEDFTGREPSDAEMRLRYVAVTRARLRLDDSALRPAPATDR